MEKHPSQMMVCHEHIDEKAASSAHPETYAFCDLGAEVWCLDCNYYVCSIHAVSRHEGHRTQTVTDERVAADEESAGWQERRSGDERRQGS